MAGRLDEGVLAAAQCGDGDAFAVIWRELSPVVAGYVTARGVSDPDSVTSDVFLALLPKLRDLTGGVAGLRTFVFSVAHARVVDDARQRTRRPAVIEFDPRSHAGVAASAEQDALARIGSEGILELLAGLRPDHRDVLALRVAADLDLEQTARVMGRSVGSVKQLQRRALIALRAQLEQAGGVTGAAIDSITRLS
ncbi:MAG TPA: sigma-70 family RNA polymerase sigma factor [Jatrophihabitans sp.]|nr:sigma-70 family RNA polymerase sigma factor [Jatrophihabitans sp.]